MKVVLVATGIVIGLAIGMLAWLWWAFENTYSVIGAI